MANGSITNYNPSSSAISGYLNTNYPIRTSGQCFKSTDVSTVEGITTDTLSVAINDMENIKTACKTAISNCGTDALSMIDGSNSEINTFPASIQNLYDNADSLKNKLITLRDSVNALAKNAVSNDQTLLNNWLNSDEYKATQTPSNKTV